MLLKLFEDDQKFRVSSFRSISPHTSSEEDHCLERQSHKAHGARGKQAIRFLESEFYS